MIQGCCVTSTWQLQTRFWHSNSQIFKVYSPPYLLRRMDFHLYQPNQMQATYQKVTVGIYFKVVLTVIVNNNTNFYSYIALQFFEPEREHWVATAYIDGQVRLYDSKFTGSLSTCLTKQIMPGVSECCGGRKASCCCCGSTTADRCNRVWCDSHRKWLPCCMW